MTNAPRKTHCPECTGSVTRRQFINTVGSAGLAAGTAAIFSSTDQIPAAPSPTSTAETLVKSLFDTLTEAQKQTVVLPWNDPLRGHISANWRVTEPSIGSDFYTNEQRELIRGIFRNLTSGDGYERFLKQMEEDAGGFGNYSMAIFGQPGSGKFQWEMTGRHLTARADGDSVENTAFGGPIVYGHGTGDSMAGLPGNLFYYQLQRANDVFAALDGRQRQEALLKKAPPETQVSIQGPRGSFPGIAIGELSSDQRELVEETMKTVLAPYRREDVEEVMALLKSGGGFEDLHLSFYETDNLGHDQEWEIWRLESPSLVWHFRGSPHVHTYVNIAKKA